MTIAQVLTSGGVVALGALSPGPDFDVVMRRSVLAGRKHCMPAAVDVTAGILDWAMIAKSTTPTAAG
ncbi:hypothetical protein [Micromonospora sp. NPDC002575]|uniref:hypothetical protein n=1 Tax=Micromonospora sp. NPDC002575 TaxID=3364222 RepID=UPI0036B29B5F